MPKYARLECERRFRVDPARCPPLAGRAHVLIEDLYIAASRLRLRRITAPDAPPQFKLCRKYPSADAYATPITNLYLDAGEYAQLAALPGARLRKRRYHLDGISLDWFDAPHPGLLLAEFEAPTRAALLARTPPAWVGPEVTTDPRYTGAALAQAG